MVSILLFSPLSILSPTPLLFLFACSSLFQKKPKKGSRMSVAFDSSEDSDAASDDLEVFPASSRRSMQDIPRVDFLSRKSLIISTQKKSTVPTPPRSLRVRRKVINSFVPSVPLDESLKFLPSSSSGRHEFMGSQSRLKENTEELNIPAFPASSSRAKHALQGRRVPCIHGTGVLPMGEMGKFQSEGKQFVNSHSPIVFESEMLSPPSGVDKLTLKATCKQLFRKDPSPMSPPDSEIPLPSQDAFVSKRNPKDRIVVKEVALDGLALSPLSKSPDIDVLFSTPESLKTRRNPRSRLFSQDEMNLFFLDKVIQNVVESSPLFSPVNVEESLDDIRELQSLFKKRKASRRPLGSDVRRTLDLPRNEDEESPEQGTSNNTGSESGTVSFRETATSNSNSTGSNMRKSVEVFKSKKMSDLDIVTTSRKYCCKKLCLHKLGVKGIRDWRTKVFRQTQNARLFSLQCALQRSGENNSNPWFYVVGGNQVCQKAFKLVNGVGNSTLSKLKQKDKMNPTSGKGVGRLVGMKTFEAVEWLSSFFETRVEHIPNKPYSHLSDTYSQLEVWKEYRISQGSEESPISYSHFL